MNATFVAGDALFQCHKVIKFVNKGWKIVAHLIWFRAILWKQSHFANRSSEELKNTFSGNGTHTETKWMELFAILSALFCVNSLNLSMFLFRLSTRLLWIFRKTTGRRNVHMTPFRFPFNQFRFNYISWKADNCLSKFVKVFKPISSFFFFLPYDGQTSFNVFILPSYAIRLSVQERKSCIRYYLSAMPLRFMDWEEKNWNKPTHIWSDYCSKVNGKWSNTDKFISCSEWCHKPMKCGKLLMQRHVHKNECNLPFIFCLLLQKSMVIK